MEAIVFIILQTSFSTRTVLKIGEYHSDIIQSRNAFTPIEGERKHLMGYKPGHFHSSVYFHILLNYRAG